MINIRLIYTVIGVFYTLANANWELLLSIAVLNMHCMFVYRQNMCFRNFKHQQMVGWLWGVILPCFFSISIAHYGKILQQKVMFEGFEHRPEVQFMEDEAWLRGV